MWITILILVPILFVIGTVVSALNEQRRLENGLLKKVIAERKKERELHMQKLLEQERQFKAQSALKDKTCEDPSKPQS
jgi:putative exporter of polyketide antibiotics